MGPHKRRPPPAPTAAPAALRRELTVVSSPQPEQSISFVSKELFTHSAKQLQAPVLLIKCEPRAQEETQPRVRLPILLDEARPPRPLGGGRRSQGRAWAAGHRADCAPPSTGVCGGHTRRGRDWLTLQSGACPTKSSSHPRPLPPPALYCSPPAGAPPAAIPQPRKPSVVWPSCHCPRRPACSVAGPRPGL